MEELPEEIKMAIRTTNLAYLFDREDATPYKLTKANKAQTHGAILNGRFISCLMGTIDLPIGMDGWLFESPKYFYDKYVWVGDQQWPAKDAKCYQTGSYFTFITIVDLADGIKVAADLFAETTYGARQIGKEKDNEQG